MVSKSKKQATVEKEQKKGRIKVGKLKHDPETVKDLSTREVRKIRGGSGKACWGGGTTKLL